MAAAPNAPHEYPGLAFLMEANGHGVFNSLYREIPFVNAKLLKSKARDGSRGPPVREVPISVEERVPEFHSSYQ